jgi:hypothetical protein
MASFYWNENFRAKLDSEIPKRLLTAGEVVKAEAVRSIGTSFRTAGPSAAGDPPHARTGQLRQSVFTEYDHARKVVIVGTPLKRGLFLEIGTSTMAARPWLRPALNVSRDKIKGIFSRPLPTG